MSIYISLFAIAISVIYATKLQELSEVTTYVQIQSIVNQECTNPGRQVAVATKFFTPDICGTSVWKLLYITLLAPEDLRWVIWLENLYTTALN
jgi:hypothetical protein